MEPDDRYNYSSNQSRCFQDNAVLVSVNSLVMNE